jgi:hypothetical protein
MPNSGKHSGNTVANATVDRFTHKKDKDSEMPCSEVHLICSTISWITTLLVYQLIEADLGFYAFCHITSRFHDKSFFTNCTFGPTCSRTCSVHNRVHRLRCGQGHRGPADLKGLTGWIYDSAFGVSCCVGVQH